MLWILLKTLHDLYTYWLHGAESFLRRYWFAASQEIPRISQNTKVHYCTHKRPPPVSIMGQPNPVHRPTCHLLEILTYLLTYLLTPWCRVLLEKLTGLQLVKKFPAFHGTRRFIIALTSVRHYKHPPRVFLKVFYREGLLAPRPTPKLEDHPSSAVCDCLFNLFAATLLIRGRSSIGNLRMRHAVVTGCKKFVMNCDLFYI